MTSYHRPQDAQGCIAALLSPCGTGNLGDAAIQDAMLEQLRHRSPGARFVGITLGPADTEARHGIPGFPIDIFRRKTPYDGEPEPLDAPLLRPFPRELQRLYAQARSITADPQFPYDVSVSRLSRIWRRATLELRHFILALRLFRHVDVLIISGGGQLDDLWGGARQHPWALFKWTLAAKLHRRPILMTSVGAGHLRSRYSRWLVRRTLRRISFATCRDRRSAHVVRLLGGRPISVVPDLALGYISGTQAGPASDGTTRTTLPHLGLAPMAFGDSRVWPENHTEQFRHYMNTLAETAQRLADGGSHVTIFSTTPADARVASELFETIKLSVSSDARARLALAIPATVEELMRTLRSVDVVLASRLHALILATDCMRPLVAVACEWKVQRFLADLNLSKYCHRFTRVSPDKLLEDILSAAAEFDRIGAQMKTYRVHAETLLLPQYHHVATVLNGTAAAGTGHQAR